MNSLPTDPSLPPGFYNTPNDERPEAELELWWDKPFARTTEDGSFDVQCLNGGTWDRPTFYGIVGSMEEAVALASSRQAEWHWYEQQPVWSLGESTIAMMVIPRRPGSQPQVLAQFPRVDQDAAGAWINKWRAEHPKPDFPKR